MDLSTRKRKDTSPDAKDESTKARKTEVLYPDKKCRGCKKRGGMIGCYSTSRMTCATCGVVSDSTMGFEGERDGEAPSWDNDGRLNIQSAHWDDVYNDHQSPEEAKKSRVIITGYADIKEVYSQLVPHHVAGESSHMKHIRNCWKTLVRTVDISKYRKKFIVESFVIWLLFLESDLPSMRTLRLKKEMALIQTVCPRFPTYSERMAQYVDQWLVSLFEEDGSAFIKRHICELMTLVPPLEDTVDVLHSAAAYVWLTFDCLRSTQHRQLEQHHITGLTQVRLFSVSGCRSSTFARLSMVISSKLCTLSDLKIPWTVVHRSAVPIEMANLHAGPSAVS